MEGGIRQVPSNIMKFVFFGPESTGKTTLARELAKQYETEWVPEYARTYLQEKWDRSHEVCAPGDLYPIALGQMTLENERTKKAGELLFLDTDLLETAVYSKAYYGYTDDWLMEAAMKNHYDLYFLTYIDVPWEKDDLRDKPDEREEMFSLFEQMLIETNRPYVVLKGDLQTRLHKVNQIIHFMKNTGLTGADVAQLEKRGIALEQAELQLKTLKKGTPWQKLIRPAVIGDGILDLDEKEKERLARYFDEKAKKFRMGKFVPASGAATRMFRDCFRLNDAWKENPDAGFDEITEKTGLTKCRQWDAHFPLLAFYRQWLSVTKKLYPGFDSFNPDEQKRLMTKALLDEKGLNYGNTPKALVLFHKYEKDVRTAFAEHLAEAVAIANKEGVVLPVHFTINPEKETMFALETQRRDEQFPVPVSFSYQNPATDTIMTDENANPVRDDEGKLLFRPGGHGSLLENLLKPGMEMLFIKNIDNVQKDEYKFDTYLYYKVLGGKLMETVEKIHAHLWALENLKPTGKDLEEIIEYVKYELQVPLIDGFDTLPNSHKRQYLFYKLNRPVRVAGMVPNTGEPGGGPFWVEDEEGQISLQIIEKSQINTKDEKQAEILSRATHFNPVFMAVYLKDFKGAFFSLPEFVKKNTGFVSEKTLKGKPVRVYEHPGLWNGSMYHWITIFVEVPLSVFSPVKTFYDLTVKPHV